MHIVFIEDQRMLQESLRPHLCSLKGGEVTVTEVCALAGALEITDIEAISLFLVSLELLGATGIERLVKACGGVPVIALSGSCDRTSMMQVMRAGAAGLILRQSSCATLLSAISLVLTGERYTPSRLLDGGEDSPADPSEPPSRLTTRELDILLLLKEGLSNKRIARRLAISEVTVKSHLVNIYRKLGVRNRVQAAQWELTQETPVFGPLSAAPRKPLPLFDSEASGGG